MHQHVLPSKLLPLQKKKNSKVFGLKTKLMLDDSPACLQNLNQKGIYEEEDGC